MSEEKRKYPFVRGNRPSRALTSGVVVAAGVLGSYASITSVAHGAGGATAGRQSKCERYLPNVMNPGQVSRAMRQPLRDRQSIVGATVDAVQRANPSTRQVSHSDGETVTDVSYVAPLAGSNTKGTYFIETYSKGRLTPTDITSIQLSETPGTFTGNYWASPLAHVESRYDFWLYGGSNEATETLAPGNRFDWTLRLFYGQGKADSDNFGFDSTTRLGNELVGGPGLTRSVLNATGSQFVAVIERAERRKSIAYEQVLPGLSGATRNCG